VARLSHDDDRPTVDLGPRGEGFGEPDAADAADGDGDGGDGEAGGDHDADRGDHPDAAPGDLTRTVAPRRASTDPVHSMQTQQLGGPRRGSESQHTRYSTTTSPVEAMKHEEIARTQVFLRAAIATSIAAVVIAVLTGGDPVAFRLVIAGCITTTAGASWMLWVTRDPQRYSQRSILVPALVIAIGSFGGVYYWGVGSPVAAMIVYGIYFFALGANGRLVTAMYILVAVTHAAFALLIIAGVIGDRGIISIEHLRTMDQIGVVAVIEFLYLITFITARFSQRATLEAVSRLEQAVRSVAQRDALLAEARAELDRALKIGGPGRFTEQVVGSYRLGVLIGRGGMGEVYEAHSVTDQREAAVKLLHPGTLGDPVHVQRFLREAEMSARLDSPHVVRVLEVGTTAGEVPYLAMERLRGHDLAHQLRRQRRIQLAAARTLADEIAEGLEAARDAGIVHRDLKPHNVFHAEATAGTRAWKILDFGVSKSGGTGTLTKGHVVGTPAYMAPEQARGEDVDHRADVYSLAAILYRAVTGHPAFTGKDVPTTLYDVVYRVPTQPSILAALPADVDRVLALGLAKDPRDRFATAAELARWFAAAVDAGLAQDQRRRADDLVAKSPWGTRQGISTSG
jgi:serine/threonine-protein kinase